MERLNSLPDTINKHQMLFGINQGGVYEDIRIKHADEISKLDLDGYAVGGLAVGESHEEMYRILDAVVPHLPDHKPTYLMGVGTPVNILEAVDRGVDFFDCVYPSRNGRHGHVYTNHGKLNLFNAKFELDDRPKPFVVPNSVKVVNGQYVENDIPIVHWGGASSAVNTYYNNASNYAQYRNWILPKDYLKLREITLSYSLPKAWLKQTPFSMVQVSLIGRNLFMWTPKKNNYVDPEGTNYGNDILSEIGEFGAAPTNRTFGGGIKVVL